MSPGCHQGVTWVSPECRRGIARVTFLHPCFRTFELSLHSTRVVNSNLRIANKILRQAEFQICVTLPHLGASETLKKRNTFIPTFWGHWSPNPSPRRGLGNLTSWMERDDYKSTYSAKLPKKTQPHEYACAYMLWVK